MQNRFMYSHCVQDRLFFVILKENLLKKQSSNKKKTWSSNEVLEVWKNEIK